MNDIETGWLSPSGEFIPCEIYEHLTMANILLTELLLCDATLDAYYTTPDDYLCNHGWVKITRESFMGHSYLIIWDRPLTELQKNYLRPIFEDENIHILISTSSICRWEKECDGRQLSGIDWMEDES